MLEDTAAAFRNPIVFFSFAATLSLTLNTRLTVLLSSWQMANANLLGQKKLLAKMRNDGEVDSSYYRRHQLILEHLQEFQTYDHQHFQMVRLALVCTLSALLLDLLAAFFSTIGSFAENLDYVAVILIWTGLVLCGVSVVVLLVDTWSSLTNFDSLNQFVLQLRKRIVKEINKSNEVKVDMEEPLRKKGTNL